MHLNTAPSSQTTFLRFKITFSLKSFFSFKFSFSLIVLTVSLLSSLETWHIGALSWCKSHFLQFLTFSLQHLLLLAKTHRFPFPETVTTKALVSLHPGIVLLSPCSVLYWMERHTLCMLPRPQNPPMMLIACSLPCLVWNSRPCALWLAEISSYFLPCHKPNDLMTVH